MLVHRRKLDHLINIGAHLVYRDQKTYSIPIKLIKETIHARAPITAPLVLVFPGHFKYLTDRNPRYTSISPRRNKLATRFGRTLKNVLKHPLFGRHARRHPPPTKRYLGQIRKERRFTCAAGTYKNGRKIRVARSPIKRSLHIINDARSTS